MCFSRSSKNKQAAPPLRKNKKKSAKLKREKKTGGTKEQTSAETKEDSSFEVLFYLVLTISIALCCILAFIGVYAKHHRNHESLIIRTNATPLTKISSLSEFQANASPVLTHLSSPLEQPGERPLMFKPTEKGVGPTSSSDGTPTKKGENILLASSGEGAAHTGHGGGGMRIDENLSSVIAMVQMIPDKDTPAGNGRGGNTKGPGGGGSGNSSVRVAVSVATDAGPHLASGNDSSSSSDSSSSDTDTDEDDGMYVKEETGQGTYGSVTSMSSANVTVISGTPGVDS